MLYTYFIGIEDLEVIAIFTSLALLAIEPLFYVLFPIILIGEIIFAYSAIKGTGKVGNDSFVHCIIVLYRNDSSICFCSLLRPSSSH